MSKMLHILVLLLSFLLTFSDGCGTDPKVVHVGVLCGLDAFTGTIDGFKSKMAELGYREGISIVYDIQNTDVEPVRENEILQKFIRDKVDLVFTFPTTVSVEAKQALQQTDIPLVFAHSNIEHIHLVKSILEPGKNVTGVRYPGPDISLKRLELLLEIVPNAKRILLPYDRSLTIIASQIEMLRRAAKSSGITLVELPTSSVGELETNIAGLASAKDTDIDAILIIPEPLAVSQQGFRILAKYAAEKRIPLGGTWRTLGDFSTIWSVSTDTVAVGKQAAILVDRILKGTPAGSIPVVSAESYIQINCRAAMKLGIRIPDGLLKQADQIVR